MVDVLCSIVLIMQDKERFWEEEEKRVELSKNIKRCFRRRLTLDV